jgi:hypothetical protein
VSELRPRLTIWFLRLFPTFRALERRAERLSASSWMAIQALPKASADRIEAELLHTLLLHTSCLVDVDLLPTERVSWLGPGQVRVRMFEGGGRG